MDSRQVVARFEAERQALAMMDHPNIARILDAGTTTADSIISPKSDPSSPFPNAPARIHEGRPYFVMELVRGIKITEYCDQSQLSTEARIKLFIQVCFAIQHAHQKGIIHRDIKPSNILVTLHDGVPIPKVIDFGIAKATQGELTDKTLFTQLSQFIGTPAYMSPEQAEMSGMDIDTRADIYSLGVLLYELLVGQTPFDATEMMKGGIAALRDILRAQEPPRPSTKFHTMQREARTTTAKRRQLDPKKLVSKLRGDLDWVVLKALEKDRSRRYESATAFADDLQRYLSGEPVSAVAPTPLYLIGKYARRHKTAVALAAGIAALLVLTAIYSLAQAVKARKAAEAAIEAEQRATTSQGIAEAERDRATHYASEHDTANQRLKTAAARAEFSTGILSLEAQDISKGIAHLARCLRTDPTYWPAQCRLLSTLSDRGFVLDAHPTITNAGPIYDHVLNRSTGLLVTRGSEYDFRVWKAWTGEMLLDLPATGNRKMPTLNHDGDRLVVVDTNGTGVVYAPFTQPNTPIATLRDDTRVVEAILSPAKGPGLLAATRRADGTVRLWNAETGMSLGPQQPGSTNNGSLFAFTQDGRWLAASSSDNRVTIWPVTNELGVPRQLITRPESSLTLTPDSQTLVERASDGLGLRFWELASGLPRSESIPFDFPLSREPGEPLDVPLGTSHGHRLAFSKDGQRLLAVSHETFRPYTDRILHDRMDIHWFDTTTGKRIHTISQTNVTHHEENLIYGLSAMVINTNQLFIRSLTTGKTTMERSWPTEAILTTRFTPSGDRILVALTDRRLILFDTQTGDQLTHGGDPAMVSHVAGGSGRLPGQTYFMRHGPRLESIEFSPEADVFITTYEDTSLQLWDADEGIPLCEPVPNTATPIGFSTDGQWLCTIHQGGGGGARHLQLGWIRVIGRNVSAARYPTLPFEGHSAVLHFSPDGRFGVVGNRGLVIFNPATGQTLATIPESETGPIHTASGLTWLHSEAYFSPSCEQIVVVCKPKGQAIVKVFQTSTGRTLHTLPIDPRSSPLRARFAGENRLVVESHTYAADTLPLRVWDLPSMRVVVETRPPIVSDIFDVSRDGRRIAICNPGISLLNATNLSSIVTIPRNPKTGETIYTLAFSPDSRHLATGSTDGFLRVWDAETGALVSEFNHGAMPRWVDFSPDSQRVVAAGSGAYDIPSIASVWEFANGAPRKITSSIVQPSTLVYTSFSKDGRLLMAGDRGGLAQLWDLETSLPVLNPLFVDGDGGISRVGINPQGTRVFALSRTVGQLHYRPLPPRNGTAPDWLPMLAEAVAGKRINDDGALEISTTYAIPEIRALVSHLPPVLQTNEFFAEWARWFFADRSQRTLSPSTSTTIPMEVDSLLAHGSKASLRRARALQPTNPRVFTALARQLASSQAHPPKDLADATLQTSAEWHSRKAIELTPDSVEAHWTLAEVLLQLNLTSQACSAVSNAVQLAPSDPNVMAIQSELALRDGRTNEAHAWMTRALNSKPSTPRSTYLDNGILATRREFFEEASLRNSLDHQLPRRSARLAHQFIDLTPWYGQALSSTATEDATPNPDLGETVFTVETIPFDHRGEVAVANNLHSPRTYTTLRGVPIDQKCHRVHVLVKRANASLSLQTPGERIELGARYRRAKSNAKTVPVNLKPHVNVPIDRAPHVRPGDENDSNWGELRSGLHTFQGVAFQIDGLVQLNGSELRAKLGAPVYPDAVQGIQIQRACQWLHFAHATGWGDGSGDAGRYVIHYADGQTETIPLTLGAHFKDWYKITPDQLASNPHIAFATRSFGNDIGFFLMSWPNPRPNVSITHLDFHSAIRTPSPFLLAISTEE